MNNLVVFYHLLKRDLLTFWRQYPSKLFDTCFLFFTQVIVTGYLMTTEWVNPSYGPFIVISAIGTFGLIEIVGKVSIFIADIEGERTISNTLILPIRSIVVFSYIAILWALTSTLLSFILLPLGKLLLFHRFEISKISYIRFIPMYLTANLFYGFFSLWLTSVIRGIQDLNALWMRVINPLWMFGAYFYSWKNAFELSAVIGWISLVNPMVYILEGMHAAALGQEGYLPFWICISVTWLFIIVFAAHAFKRLKKRLDCV